MSVYGKITFTDDDKAFLLRAHQIAVDAMRVRRATAKESAEVAFYEGRLPKLEADRAMIAALLVGKPVPFTKERLDDLRSYMSAASIALRDALWSDDKALIKEMHDAYHSLDAKLSKPYANDTSQDAEPDEGDEG